MTFLITKNTILGVYKMQKSLISQTLIILVPRTGFEPFM